MKELIIWDFDDTFIRTPGPEAFKELIDNKILDIDKINEDRILFWEDSISLDTNYFQLVSKKPVVDLFKSYEDQGNVEHILITNRSTRMLPQINRILKGIGVNIPHIYSGTDYGGKINVLKNHIKKHSPYDYFVVVEDSIHNLYDYQEFFLSSALQHKFIFVNTHSMGEIVGRIPRMTNEQDVQMILHKD